VKSVKVAVLLGVFSVSAVVSQGTAGTLSGKISFEGTQPQQESIKMDADPICKMQHSADVYAEKLVVNSNGTLKNVLVYVKEGLGDQKYDVPAEPAILDQKGCQYFPHVFGMRVGQTLKIVNDDDTLHNVHGKTRQASLFNLAMPFKGLELEQKIEQADMVKFVCEVHPWMNAYAGVFNHPFFAVSNDQGTFEIKDLPAGNYVIEAWHERCGLQTQNVTVAEGESKALDFSFKAPEQANS
jgi:plastocyanin